MDGIMNEHILNLLITKIKELPDADIIKSKDDKDMEKACYHTKYNNLYVELINYGMTKELVFEPMLYCIRFKGVNEGKELFTIHFNNTGSSFSEYYTYSHTSVDTLKIEDENLCCQLLKNINFDNFLITELSNVENKVAIYSEVNSVLSKKSKYTI